jgi:hypothetical protein
MPRRLQVRLDRAVTILIAGSVLALLAAGCASAASALGPASGGLQVVDR